jgi:hypothetical protein
MQIDIMARDIGKPYYLSRFFEVFRRYRKINVSSTSKATLGIFACSGPALY